MQYEPQYDDGLKVGPYPGDKYIIINPDGTIYIETNEKDLYPVIWIRGQTVKGSTKSTKKLNTSDYRTMRYRKLMDFPIGYLEGKIIRIHTMVGSKNDIYIDLTLQGGKEIRYINEKYTVSNNIQ